MQNVFLDTRVLDKIAREKYNLSEDIMMENAASALRDTVLSVLSNDKERCLNRPAVLVLAGSGNNGADGYALARQLVSHDIAVTVCAVGEPKSQMCILQEQRAKGIGVRIIDALELDSYLDEEMFDTKCIVDCIFGSGFHGELPLLAKSVIEAVNKEFSYKIACDVPSGLDSYGNGSVCFIADETVTMGAQKLSLYSDLAKDVTGRIKVAFLGISQDNFERGADGVAKSDAYLLEKQDIKLPYRKKQNTNKGSFGHVCIAKGEKEGAAVMAGNAALSFGAGLVTLVSDKVKFGYTNFELMTSSAIPENTSSMAVGMGLGRLHEDSLLFFSYLMQNKEIPAVLDADVFYNKDIVRLLKQRPRGLLLTPHPKEFLSLLTLTGLNKVEDVEITKVSECVKYRYALAKQFCTQFPNLTLLLKGANTLICSKEDEETGVKFYINNLGTSALSKAGSGDVLSGLASALLSQGYSTNDAAITASLAHALAACNTNMNNYAVTPSALLESIKYI